MNEAPQIICSSQAEDELISEIMLCRDYVPALHDTSIRALKDVATDFTETRAVPPSIFIFKGVLSENPEESFHKYFFCLLASRDLHPIL